MLDSKARSTDSTVAPSVRANSWIPTTGIDSSGTAIGIG